MIEVRKKFDRTASLSPQIAKGKGGDEVEELTRNGIWSDSHLLALMYAGEMCYWRYNCWKGTQKEDLEYKRVIYFQASLIIQESNRSFVEI